MLTNRKVCKSVAQGYVLLRHIYFIIYSILYGINNKIYILTK